MRVVNKDNPVVTLENVTVYEDLGSFGDGKWQKHLTITSWYGREPKYDLRTWNSDMTKYGKGITLDDADLFDLMNLLEEVL